jgi:hypothetical protein
VTVVLDGVIIKDKEIPASPAARSTAERCPVLSTCRSESGRVVFRKIIVTPALP